MEKGVSNCNVYISKSIYHTQPTSTQHQQPANQPTSTSQPTNPASQTSQPSQPASPPATQPPSPPAILHLGGGSVSYLAFSQKWGSSHADPRVFKKQMFYRCFLTCQNVVNYVQKSLNRRKTSKSLRRSPGQKSRTRVLQCLSKKKFTKGSDLH